MQQRKVIAGLAIMLSLTIASVNAYATLIDLGDFVYQESRNLTWTDFWFRGTYEEALDWAQNLVVMGDDGTIYSDWRLPSTQGYTSTDQFLQLYLELGNEKFPKSDKNILYSDPFDHLLNNWYWYGENTSVYEDRTDIFAFNEGTDTLCPTTANLFAMAVHGGIANGNLIDTTVPESATMLLFGMGLLSIAGIGRRRFNK